MGETLQKALDRQNLNFSKTSEITKILFLFSQYIHHLISHEKHVRILQIRIGSKSLDCQNFGLVKAYEMNFDTVKKPFLPFFPIEMSYTGRNGSESLEYQNFGFVKT